MTIEAPIGHLEELQKLKGSTETQTQLCRPAPSPHHQQPTYAQDVVDNVHGLYRTILSVLKTAEIFL
jgi:hypothetical protein